MQKNYQFITQNDLISNYSNNAKREQIIIEILEGYDRLVSEFKKM